MAFQYGICEWTLAVNGFGAVALAGKLGFDGIQLSDLGGSQNNYPLNNRRLQEAYRQAAEENGVILQSLHLYTLVREGHLKCPPQSEGGRRGLISIRKGLEACEAMGIPALMVTSYDACQIQNEYDFENTAMMLREGCRLAAELGVRLVYESVTDAASLLKMRDCVGKDLKLCYDTLNPVRFGKGDPLEEIPRLEPQAIDCVHVKDAPDNLTGCCLLGTGRGKFAASAAALSAIGYNGWVITENYYHLPPMGEDADALKLAQRDLETMNQSFPRP